MATCPSCNADIQEDFGLVTCPSCGVQVMIEFDGSVAARPQGVALDHIENPQPLEAIEYSAPEPEPATSPDMADIAEYGNSTVSQGREGLLRFDLYLSGIDTSDVRAQLREALADSRFLWDADQLLGDIREGVLQIKEVTAVKSALLIQRLRSVPVEIRWEQYAIHQM